MVRGPPNLRRETDAPVAQSLDSGREQKRLTDRCHLGLEALLCGLAPEGAEVWRYHHACHDLTSGVLESADIVREIVRQRLIATRIGQLKPLGCQWCGQAQFGMPPGVAIGVVREQTAHFLGDPTVIPEASEVRDDVLEAPEEVIGIGKAFRRITATAEEIRLPWCIGRNAWDLVDLRLVSDWIGRVRRRGCRDDVHLVV